jgi:hypothetical protein
MSAREDMLDRLAPFRDKWELLDEDQTTNDIVKAVLKKHRECQRDYDRIVDVWMDGDLATLPKKLFNFCKRNLPYKEESQADQTVRSPGGILSMKGCDCKHYSGFIAGVLDAVNRTGEYYYDWYYRFVSEELLSPSPHHVFIVVRHEDNAETWIDPVPMVGGYDTRPFYFWKYEKRPKPMALYSISGTTKKGFVHTTTVKAGGVPLGVAGRPVGKISPVNALSGYARTPARMGATGDVIQPVPAGYPSNLPQAVLTADGKLVLNKKGFPTTPQIQQIQAMLQPLIIKYSKTPYNIYWSIPGWGSGAGNIVEAMGIFGTKDFLQYPAMPSGLDKIEMGVNTILPTLVGAAANAAAPGSGAAASSVVSSNSKPATNTAVSPDLTTAQLTALQQGTAPVSTTLVQLAEANPVPALLIAGGIAYALYAIFKA